jgi:ABC-type proline/glycine betaine transport system ATPase subunit
MKIGRRKKRFDEKRMEKSGFQSSLFLHLGEQKLFYFLLTTAKQTVCSLSFDLEEQLKWGERRCAEAEGKLIKYGVNLHIILSSPRFKPFFMSEFTGNLLMKWCQSINTQRK